MHAKKFLFAAVLCGSAFSLPAEVRVSVGIGASVAPAPVVIREVPPRPVVERVTVAPSREHIWIAGHWSWEGRWVWISGRWERRPHPGCAWEPGHWVQREGGWIWVEGHWVGQEVVAAPAPPPPPEAPEVIVQDQPPAAYVETIPVSPGPDYIWIGGHWGREHNRWAWVHGRYERRPHREAIWTQGHWDHRSNGWIWIEGRWR